MKKNCYESMASMIELIGLGNKVQTQSAMYGVTVCFGNNANTNGIMADVIILWC